jgi:hypothetical protein
MNGFTMDERNEVVFNFLHALQDAMTQLGDVWNFYKEKGAHPKKPFFTLSGRPFKIHNNDQVYHGAIAFGLIVHSPEGKEYDIGIDVLWNDTGWVIETEAWVESENNLDLIRALPSFQCSDLNNAINHIPEAIRSLYGFEDLIFQFEEQS